MYEWPADRFWINTSCSGVDFDFCEPEIFMSIAVWRVALYTTAPVALSATMMTNDWVIPPSNPGVHWRWNVSLDLLITVQFSTGSGATRIDKDVNIIQKTVYCKLHNPILRFNIKVYYTFNIFHFLYATHHFPYFLHVILKTANVWSFSSTQFIFLQPRHCCETLTDHIVW